MLNNFTKTWKLSLSILTFSLAASTVDAQTCTEQPTCEELGYTHTAEACNGQKTLKCPLDTELVFCISPKCMVGDIVYSDGKCYSNPPTGLTAKGVVFDPENKKMIVGGQTPPDPLLPLSLAGGCAGESGGESSPLLCGYTEQTCKTYHDGKTNFDEWYRCAPTYLAADQYRPFRTAAAQNAYIANLSEVYKIYQNKSKLSPSCTKAGIDCQLSSKTIASLDLPQPTDGRYWVLNFTSGAGELVERSNLYPVIFLSSY